MADVLAAAVSSGAFGAALSGAGPCLIAFVRADEKGAVGPAMVAAFARHGVNAKCFDLAIDPDGAKVVPMP